MSDDRHGTDDEVARRLRDALTREADMVRPGDDGLERIHTRLEQEPATEEDRRRAASSGSAGESPGWVPWVAGIAAAAVIAVVATLAVQGRGDDPVTPVASPGPTASTTPSEPAPTPSDPAPTPTTPPVAGTLDQIPVYWTQTRPSGVTLYREFRSVPDAGGPLVSAVRAMMTLTPLDPDYSSPWRQPSSVTVTQEGDALTVDVSADAFARADVDDELATAAVQQLVWTVTAAAQSPGPVTVLVDGAPGTAWGSVDLGGPTTRDPDARGSIWVDSPTEGAAVAAGPLDVSGTSTAFEGTVSWEVTGPGGAVLDSGFTQGGANGTFAPYAFTTVPLAAGTVTVSVWAEDVSGGEAADGPRLGETTRVVTVG